MDRLSKMPVAAAEYTVSRTYLDWMVALPWAVRTEEVIDLARTKSLLDEDHSDLEKAKARILEYLAVRKLNPKIKRPILCFVGPPGVGKTSLAKSIAASLGRKLVRISLGGMRDEAEIRGHRRTYIGALPGQIIQGLRRVESKNPVFVLDEIDKLGADFRGDPASALLEVLDPEQNNTFRDYYLDVPFDLSEILFITTANFLDPVPHALRDRMEVLELSGYTDEEKLTIAREHLVEQQIETHGLGQEHVSFEDAALQAVIRGYTREAGVRNLEREIGALCRKVARRRAEGSDVPVVVTPDEVVKMLGAPKFYDEEVADRTKEPGVAVGLAWTPAGGEVLFVEATLMSGGRTLTLTGQLGDVMKESAQTALSWFRAHAEEYGVDEDFYQQAEIHVHVPSGAIPKDGPSAGVTLATALASRLTKRPVRQDLAMTGEVTLSGRVLPVGGIKEKVLAARRLGIAHVVVPHLNRKNIDEDLSDQLRQEMTIHYVSSVEEVLKLALEPAKVFDNSQSTETPIPHMATYPPCLPAMRVVHSPRYEIDVGAHVYPTAKYGAVCARVIRAGILKRSAIVQPQSATWAELGLVHTPGYLDKVRRGTLTALEIDTLEIPWSASIVDGLRLVSGGTIVASRMALRGGVVVHLGGGFHHAFAGHGEGFCLFNDVAVALRVLRREGEVEIAAVLDCDVHQGNGTARIFEEDPAVFTCSMHQQNNYPLNKPPSSLDIALADGVGDSEYLAHLQVALAAVSAADPDLLVYLAGADPYEDDQLGGLALTQSGLRERDRQVFQFASSLGVPVVVVLAGGYARRFNDTVSIHTATVEEAVATDA